MVNDLVRAATMFNDMAADYDDLRDLWYSWLFSRLHFFIARDVIPGLCAIEGPPSVLDIGSGTGFQAELYAAAGAHVCGIDIAEDLLRVAATKSTRLKRSYPNDVPILFPAHFSFVARYHRRISKLVGAVKHRSGSTIPRYAVADAHVLPFPSQCFDHVNCCGSVLSLVTRPEVVLAEIHRVLKPGGTFVFEVEGKYNFDAVWPFVDIAMRGKLGYESTLQEALRFYRRPFRQDVMIEYPFGEIEDPVYMNIRLYTRTGLVEALTRVGFTICKVHSIHSITNLLPTTVLDTTTPSAILRNCFGILARLEELAPIYLPGCSIVVIGKRAGGEVAYVQRVSNESRDSRS